MIRGMGVPPVRAGGTPTPQFNMQILSPDNFKHHIDRFNTMEPEGIVNLIPNAQSWDWIKQNVPNPVRHAIRACQVLALAPAPTIWHDSWR